MMNIGLDVATLGFSMGLRHLVEDSVAAEIEAKLISEAARFIRGNQSP
jgi:hypothetical protein